MLKKGESRELGQMWYIRTALCLGRGSSEGNKPYHGTNIRKRRNPSVDLGRTGNVPTLHSSATYLEALMYFLPHKLLSKPYGYLRKKWKAWIIQDHVEIEFSLKIQFILGNSKVVLNCHGEPWCPSKAAEDILNMLHKEPGIFWNHHQEEDEA